MRLTTQMKAEIETIRKRVDVLSSKLQQMVMGFDDGEHIVRATIVELKPYKVRLENILCETDIKEQAHSPMNLWDC